MFRYDSYSFFDISSFLNLRGLWHDLIKALISASACVLLEMVAISRYPSVTPSSSSPNALGVIYQITMATNAAIDFVRAEHINWW